MAYPTPRLGVFGMSRTAKPLRWKRRGAEVQHRYGSMVKAMRTIGRMKFFDSDRGFGFIRRTDGGGDVFVHRVDLGESCRVDGEIKLSPDDLVDFDVVDAGRGPKAVAVSPREGRDALATS